MSNPRGGPALGLPKKSEIILTNAENPGRFEFSKSESIVPEASNTVYVDVSRSMGSYGDVSVDYRIVGGTAVNGLDYQAAGGTLDFRDGESGQKIPININTDELAEFDDTILLQLENPTGQAVLGDKTNAELTIVNQGGTGANLSGLASDADTGKPLRDAVVRLEHTSGGSWEIQTDANGNYSFTNLNYGGGYSLITEKDAFSQYGLTDLVISHSAQVADLPLKLKGNRPSFSLERNLQKFHTEYDGELYFQDLSYFISEYTLLNPGKYDDDWRAKYSIPKGYWYTDYSRPLAVPLGDNAPWFIQSGRLKITVNIDWNGQQAGDVFFKLVDANGNTKSISIQDDIGTWTRLFWSRYTESYVDKVKSRAINYFYPEDVAIGDKIYVQVVSGEGVATEWLADGISFIEAPPIPPSDQIASKLGVSAPEAPPPDFPFLEDAVFGFDLNEDTPFRTNVDYDPKSGVATVFLGYRAAHKDKLEDAATAVKNYKNATLSKSFDIYAVIGGKFLYVWNGETQSWEMKPGELDIIAGGKISAEFKFVVFAVPAFVEGYFEGKVSAALILDGDDIEGELTPELILELAAGVGVSGVLSGKVWGNANGKLLMVWDEDGVDVDEYGIKLSYGYQLDYLGMAYRKELESHSWGNESFVAASVEEDLPTLAELTPMSREYLNQELTWLPERENEIIMLASVEEVLPISALMAGQENLIAVVDGNQSEENKSETVLQANVYPSSHPGLSKLDNGVMLVWVADDPSRSDRNRTSAAYSVYDGQTWTAPAFISSDGTADFYPKLAKTSGGAVAAWMNNASVLADDTSMIDKMQDMEIAVVAYDDQTKTWSGAQNLTSDGYYDSQPALAASGNKAMLVWTKNTGSISEDSSLNTALFAEPDKIQLMSSKWADGVWGVSQVISNGRRCCNTG